MEERFYVIGTDEDELIRVLGYNNAKTETLFILPGSMYL